MKKITAIVLCVLLAMSALVVLAACGTTEYVVSFREYNSKIIYQGKTINGKAVEPKAPAKEGYLFKGWYKTLTTTVDDSGNTVYNFADEMDFDKALDGDLNIYAKYELDVKPVASSNPYYVVGDFAGDSWNGNGVADLNRMLKPADGVLTATFNITAKQNFKVKYADVAWHDDLDVGFGALKGVTLAEGVTLPDELTVENLFVDGGGNISVAAAAATAQIELKIKLTYAENTKSINIEVLQVKACEHVYASGACTKCGAPDPAGGPTPYENGYRVVGKIGGNDKLWNSNDDAYKMTQDETDQNLFTATLSLKVGDQIKVKENCFNVNGTPNWDGASYGHGAIGTVTLDDGVTLPAGISAAADLFGGSDNIEIAKDCTITLSLDFATGALNILVTEITE